MSGWALAVMVGGGVANIAEALAFGGVTDFVPLHLGAATVIFSAGDIAVLVANVASVIALIQRRAAAAQRHAPVGTRRGGASSADTTSG
jgi:lipoprotein signal peptidase